MAKKSSVSSQPEKLKRAKSEHSRSKSLTEREQETLKGYAARQTASHDSHIDFDGIPPLTAEQLAGLTRLKERQNKIMVSVRLDPRVFQWLKAKGEGYSTRINEILANVMALEAQHNDRQRKHPPQDFSSRWSLTSLNK